MAARSLEEALDDLVAGGVLSAAQADAVRAAMAAEPTAAEPTAAEAAAPAADRGIHPAAEAAAWVGAVLAAAAGITAAAAFWADLTRWAQSALLGLTAAALLAAGVAVRDDARPPARRILGVVWFLAVGALGAAFVAGLSEQGADFSALPWTVAGAAATALAVPLWRLHPSGPQLTAVVASALATMLAALGHAERPPVELYGLLVWAAGAAVVVLAWGGLARPAGAGRLLGALIALAGAQALTFPYARWGVLLGVATVVGLLALGGVAGHVALTGVAAVALAVFVPQALHAFFPGSLNASGTLFLSGVALLAGALATIRRARRVHDVPERAPARAPEEES